MQREGNLRMGVNSNPDWDIVSALCYNIAKARADAMEKACIEALVQSLDIEPNVFCECGAEKIGGLSHSEWCPKHVSLS
jgi:hypothetical protein